METRPGRTQCEIIKVMFLSEARVGLVSAAEKHERGGFVSPEQKRLSGI